MNGSGSVRLARLALAISLLLSAGCAGSSVAGSPSDRVDAAPSVTPPELIVPTASEPEATRPPSPQPAIQAPTPTLDALGTVVASQQPRVESHPSPDGRWIAEILVYDCVRVSEEQENAYQELRLTEVETGEPMTVDSQFLFCGGLGASGLGGRFWSADSRFFYYTDARTGVPDGCGYFTSPYLRVDTLDISAEYLGMGSVSPDERKLAVWWEGDSGERVNGMLAIWDLQGELLGIAQVPPPIVLPGPIAWSPDSRSVAFLTSADYCPLGLTALGRMQLDMMIPVVILQSADPSFGGLSWDAPSLVTLTDEQGGRWSYNFATRDLRPEAP
jgi:hypothetical protein